MIVYRVLSVLQTSTASAHRVGAWDSAASSPIASMATAASTKDKAVEVGTFSTSSLFVSFHEACRRGVSPSTPVSPLLRRLMASANEVRLK